MTAYAVGEYLFHHFPGNIDVYEHMKTNFRE